MCVVCMYHVCCVHVSCVLCACIMFACIFLKWESTESVNSEKFFVKCTKGCGAWVCHLQSGISIISGYF